MKNNKHALARQAKFKRLEGNVFILQMMLECNTDLPDSAKLRAIELLEEIRDVMEVYLVA